MSASGNHLKIVLKKPRVTEKATMLADSPMSKRGPVYTFEVGSDANKKQIKSAIVERYKVTPMKVNIINLPEKKLYRRGKVGIKSGVKKALVFLKTGDKIDLV